ncbi:MAG TPA: ATP-binding protein [Bryobacteraceae bacterium]|nr:ATP-binding protein [Bryobacteraceae bacterium]
MTLRTRLLLIFTVVVVATVALVEGLVSRTTRNAFERMENQRVDALVTQFRREFARRGEEIVRAVNSIATSDAATTIALSPDPAAHYNEAPALAVAHGLDLLELVAGDGTIISSAEWPARFGYKEEWLAGWKPRGAFLRREELSDGVTLALAAVGETQAGDHTLYIAGGQRLDREFLSTLVLPTGMRVLLYRNLEAHVSAAELIDAQGQVQQAAEFLPLIEEVRKQPRETAQMLGSGTAAETFHALPLMGNASNLLGILLIGSSRAELVELEAFLRYTGVVLAGGGILVGLVLAWWATARVTRPVQALAVSAGKVAAGEWNTTVEVASGDEVGQLARAFNHMTRELAAQRERLVQAERVAAWRELARRLAHELKNPLFPLQITVENMQRAREQYPQEFDEAFREGTATLIAELGNLKQIIGRFSDFAKMPAPHMQKVNLNELAAETMKLFEAQLAQAQITASTELDAALPRTFADPEQMTRVLRNLVLNAIDAMPGGGKLTIRTRASEGGVRLEVSDTGQGLTPEECERLFTPYYTTKTHGTGLGLAIVQSVISDHHGRISVESQPGKGATFRIELPGEA